MQWDLLIQHFAILPKSFKVLRSLHEEFWADPESNIGGAYLNTSKAEPVLKYKVQNGMAIIPISGFLLDEVPLYFKLKGIAATAYNDITYLVMRAAADPAVKQIHLSVESPGGLIRSGLEQAVNTIWQARQNKLVTAHIENLGASAAYWLASQAEIISAGRNAEIGSIGVFDVYQDTSTAFKKAGIKIVLIRSGEHKGMGIDGVPISELQIDGKQEIVNSISSYFVRDVAHGRLLPEYQIENLADGRTWIARAARELRLIDEVD